MEGEEEGMASGAWSPRWFLLRGDQWPADTELAAVNEHPAARRKGVKGDGVEVVWDDGGLRARWAEWWKGSPEATVPFWVPALHEPAH